MDEFKICNKCHIEKQISEFPKNSTAKCGYRGECKDCFRPIKKEYDKKCYLKNIEKRKAYSKEYSIKNAEKIRVRAIKWAKENRERKNEYYREYNKKHSIELSEKRRKRYSEDVDFREKLLKNKKRWKENNIEKVKLSGKEYRARPEVKERDKEYKKEYEKKYRERRNFLRRERVKNNKEKYLNSTRYIKGFIIKNSNLKYADIPDELVDAYRLQLKLKREVRNVKINSK